MSSKSLLDNLRGPGLTTVLNTADYSCWEAKVTGVLGHHRSRLLSGSKSFQAHFRISQVDALQILHLKGSGELEMLREQIDQAVLWMPLQGISEEIVNGVSWVVEPGKALLFRPGDHMRGRTSEQQEGISILIPNEAMPELQQAASPMFQAGPLHHKVLVAARQLAATAAQQSAGASWAADQLMESLSCWAISVEPNTQRERITAVRRRSLVAQAQEWMSVRLPQRFGMAELSAALHVSVRTLQYAFQSELGCTPMEMTKRLRLRHLRQHLQDPELADRSIADLMAASGLLACGATAADYRQWCGESPSHTRRRKQRP